MLAMNMRAIRTFLATAFIATPLVAAAPPSDSESAKILLGSWDVGIDQYKAIKAGGYTFQANGTFTSFTVFEGDGKELRVDVEGKWAIKDGMLIETITKSSHPDLDRPGLTTRDKLLLITQKEYRFRQENGKEYSHFRSTARALAKAATGGPKIVDPAIPKGAVHLLVHNDAEARPVFTYFPYPQFPDTYQPDESHPRPPDLGIYRLDVTPEGTVSGITLLKNANRMMDVISMKTLIRWRAKPGPPRVIDVFISFGTRWLGPGSPMHPPG